MTVDLWISVGVIGALLVLSAFFSGSETAFTARSRPRLHRLERQGNHRAIILNRLGRHPDRVIGAILLGNNLTNIFASALATSTLITLMGEAGVAYAVFLMTVLIVIFGEILPKSYAIHRPNRTVLWLSRPLYAVVLVLAPITRGIQMLGRLLFRLFGVRLDAELKPRSSVEELRGTIDLSVAGSGDEKVRRAMLHSIIDLAEAEVRDIMVHRQDVIAIDADQPPDKIVEQVILSPHTRLPLWRGEPDHIIGVLHTKDLLSLVRREGGWPAAINVAALASPPWFVPDSTTLLDQLQAFRQRGEQLALVVDEYGALQGIVTLDDILEEIVGDLSADHHIPAEGAHPLPDGSYVVKGTVTVRDLNRQFDWSLPADDAATIAGLVMHEARQIPEAGQVFNFHGFRFEVLRRHRNQITSLRIRPPP